MRIFAGIHKEMKAKLLLVGDGPERGVIEHMCKEFGVCDNVLFLGKQEAIEEVLSVGDLFLLPSETESFGLAALEAMACEVPVISTNGGGLPEVNMDGVTGFACDVGDVEAMSQKAIYILSDEQRHDEFKKNSLAQAENYNINKIVPMYVQYYEKVLEACQNITAKY